jgi:DNA/RNA endonuclease G (NUC1)
MGWFLKDCNLYQANHARQAKPALILPASHAVAQPFSNILSLPATIGINRVRLPQHFFKIVYDPAINRAWAHWLDNTDEARVRLGYQL